MRQWFAFTAKVCVGFFCPAATVLKLPSTFIVFCSPTRTPASCNSFGLVPGAPNSLHESRGLRPLQRGRQFHSPASTVCGSHVCAAGTGLVLRERWLGGGQETAGVLACIFIPVTEGEKIGLGF